MAHRKKTRASGALPAHFFANQLQGEKPPSLATVKSLYALTTSLIARRPWKLLSEEQLVVVEDAASRELCFCCVMGALGEVLALHVFRGAQSYGLFKKLRKGTPVTAGEFYSEQHSVSVEFVQRKELTVPDRELLKAMDHPLAKGSVAPIYRAIRPGYHPWYVTEDEARLLADCVRAVVAVCDILVDKPETDLWAEKEVYPLVSRAGGRSSGIGTVKAPEPVLPIPKLPALDDERIRHIRERFPSRAVLEVDHFYGGGVVGQKNERKALVRIAVAIEAKDGLAYPPEVAMPDQSTGDMLADVLLRAIELRQALPNEVHVRDRESKALLNPLAEALGCTVKVAPKLPALDFMKRELLRMMGAPDQYYG